MVLHKNIKILSTIGYKALKRGLEAIFISPRKTSSACPGCGGKPQENKNRNRIVYRTNCSLTGDRDIVACVNLFLEYVRLGVLGGPLDPQG
ncbi:MAG: zinc ribbon domain-containing protein [Desulfurococcaceae archaeon]